MKRRDGQIRNGTGVQKRDRWTKTGQVDESGTGGRKKWNRWTKRNRWMKTGQIHKTGQVEETEQVDKTE